MYPPAEYFGYKSALLAKMDASEVASTMVHSDSLLRYLGDF